MSRLPRDPTPDGSVALLREGYRFIGNRCRRLGTDVFETRLLGRRTVCCRGAPAARIFYDQALMQRQGAMPGWVRNTLLGQGGVQGLDDAPHRHRKAMFMQLMTQDRLRDMAELTAQELTAEVEGWSARGHAVLRRDMQTVMFRAACRWSGVPLPRDHMAELTRDMNLMVVGSTKGPLKHWLGLRARRRAERWAAGLVEQARSGSLPVPGHKALAVIAAHRAPEGGGPLETRVAAVELLNVLRPAVALSIYVVFAALALHRYPAAREAVVQDGEAALERFVLEVRRYYPFFPFVAALAREPFTWNGAAVPRGRRVLLDLYGTNHHPDLWDAPEAFRPERFANDAPDAFELIPQGGGSHDAHHRCAGEWLTLAVMKTAVRLLTRDIRYQVPAQDLSIPFNRFPTGPRSGFVMAGITAAAPLR